MYMGGNPSSNVGVGTGGRARPKKKVGERGGGGIRPAPRISAHACITTIWEEKTDEAEIWSGHFDATDQLSAISSSSLS